MKKILLVFSLMVMALTIVRCGKEPEAPVSSIEITEEAPSFQIAEGLVSAYFHGTVSYPGTIDGISIQMDTDQAMSSATDHDCQWADSAFSLTIGDLNYNTTYYYRYLVDYGVSKPFESEVRSFVTPSVILPTVHTVSVTEITQTTALCLGELVEEEGQEEVIERGFCYGMEPDPNLEDSVVLVTSELFVATLTELTPGTTYYIKAFVTCSHGTAFGEELSFSTVAENLPVIRTLSVTDITATSAIGGGEVIDEGSSSVIRRGICWSTHEDPTIEDDHGESGNGLGTFTVEMTGLIENTTYYVRAYATNEQGTSYGENVDFLAMAGLPKVTTQEVTDITTTTAKGHGVVEEQGASIVTERGICWGLEPSPTVLNYHAEASIAGTGSYTILMTGLTSGMKYYVRAYAKNTQGYGYGEEVSFTAAQEITIPTVVTTGVSNITQNGAYCGGEVTSDGGSTVTERGICWSTTNNPTIASMHVADNAGGTGSFICQLTELDSGVTYYARAYAKNSAGIAYGDILSFTTGVPATPPTVVTTNVTDITQTSAIVNGNVTSDGGADVTERGICWSRNPNPTILGTHIIATTSGTGSYACTISGLIPGTAYHVRAYAKNSEGISYGEDKTFNTLQNDISLPTVTTANVTNITTTTAKGGGNVTSDGGAPVTERGICWSTSSNPTITGSHVAASTGGTGGFTCNITGLTQGTTYHVRAYATNSEGTSYGNEMQFTTMVDVPTVTIDEITNVTQTTATVVVNVTNNTGSPGIECGICWGTDQNPTVGGNHESIPAGITGNHLIEITRLTPGTTYHVRTYVLNGIGINYGNSLSFITSMPQTYNVTVSSNPPEGGTVTGGGPYQEGETCSLEATANAGYSFANWSENGNVVSTDANYSFPVTGDRVLIANFSLIIVSPTVTTDEVLDITHNSAVAGGNVTDDGGADVTERGICWSTNADPTTADNMIPASTNGTGSFTCDITELTPNTTYYVRAYATNSAGTSYGENKEFTTKSEE